MKNYINKLKKIAANAAEEAKAETKKASNDAKTKAREKVVEYKNHATEFYNSKKAVVKRKAKAFKAYFEPTEEQKLHGHRINEKGILTLFIVMIVALGLFAYANNQNDTVPTVDTTVPVPATDELSTDIGEQIIVADNDLDGVSAPQGHVNNDHENEMTTAAAVVVSTGGNGGTRNTSGNGDTRNTSDGTSAPEQTTSAEGSKPQETTTKAPETTTKAPETTTEETTAPTESTTVPESGTINVTIICNGGWGKVEIDGGQTINVNNSTVVTLEKGPHMFKLVQTEKSDEPGQAVRLKTGTKDAVVTFNV